ncbi:LRR receptor-like serine/threonine-protein kinase FLS2 [Dichanthelium oligosanthes]|uniref:LRR receptor-like serine/threonine-protein kinase FLS2 n=1 Tax=Dichanthelium oligosanthes TaxID=888268 RepID=A0A1E5VZ76_9POAL|nr:LRR receptor-like serine/threonine-protein kinase FLS2 [Dichanthelium oligosanthes]
MAERNILHFLHLLLPTWFLLLLQIQQSTAAASAVPVITRSTIRCVRHERDALLAFRAGLTDPGNYLSSWQGEDCCQWKGIRCSNRTGHAVELRLWNMADVRFRGGQISSSLLGLKNLRTLDLRSNNFDGAPIPEFIGGLKSLRYLFLSNSKFGGRVPPQIVNKLPSLVTLNLRFCGLQNAMPSPANVNLTSLKYLDLYGNEFSSSLGAKSLFWDLPSLLHLDMGMCDLQGSIPEEVGNMTLITRLDLSVNNLTGTIPTTFKNLRNLEVLWLGENNINGPVAVLLERLPPEKRLQELLLYENNLSGKLPNQLGHLRNLTTLSLRKNRLSGELPTGISELTKLEELVLGFNNLGGTITETHFAKMTSLTNLDLGNNSLSMVFQNSWVPSFKLQIAEFQSCKLGPKFPEWLRSQNSIYVLDISNTSIADPIPHWFWITFSRAGHLVLSRNQISGKLSPAMFGKMEASSMDFSDNFLVGSIPKLSPKLEYLDLSRNKLSGPLPSDFTAPKLSALILFRNSLSGRIPYTFCHMKEIEFIDLAGNLLEGPFPNCGEQINTGKLPSKNTSKVKQLNVLNLNGNNLFGEFPVFLQNCPELFLLDLSYNQFYGNLPIWIADKLPSLAFLSLRSNLFSGRIPLQLASLKDLQYLDIAHNNMSGTIPEALVNFMAMTRSPADNDSLSDYSSYGGGFDEVDFIPYPDTFSVVTKGQQLEFMTGIMYMVNLDLSCNSLTGHLPKGIGKLAALTSLNLSWNHLSGIIPDSIGGLHALESLDLSHNALSSEIPTGLSVLTSLSHLNLSYNNLRGEIPSGNQLQALDDQASIYIGNPGLCGPPLSKKCLETDLSPTGDGHKEGGDTISFFLAMGCGYIMGLWTIFCLFLFKKNWRVSCFSFSDHLYDWVYVQVALSWAFLTRREL